MKSVKDPESPGEATDPSEGQRGFLGLISKLSLERQMEVRQVEGKEGGNECETPGDHLDLQWHGWCPGGDSRHSRLGGQ